MTIAEEAKIALTTLKENGYEAYLVGGSVRDFLMNIKPKDWDIATNAKPDEIEAIFEKTIDTGANFGTITVIINKIQIEVTTYRIDGEYKNNRHPIGVAFTTNLVEDLKRRDFTINAIAFDGENIVDPWGGKDDIAQKIIKGVGEPKKRFEEDALRMLRAIRFSCQLGFTIEENTLNAIKEKAYLIENISKERIRAELEKTIMSDHLQNMDKLSLLGINLDYKEIINKPKDLITRLYLLGFTKEQMKTLKFSNKEISDTVHLSNAKKPQNEYEAKKLINKIGLSNWKRLTKLYELNFSTVETEPIFLKDLEITGNDLISCGITGKKIGEILNFLLDKVHKDPNLNDKNRLLEIIRG
ncbi:MAG: CCA tRNA nucleotidyltransferase [Defluviitaleaceae bacterium]|nr:CCA tRNA nucleotidyltransferase [Defluviitaleaceae bacterium]